MSEDLPEWDRLLAAERHVQALVPGTVLVGGTAAALHAGHRPPWNEWAHVAARGRHFAEILAALALRSGPAGDAR